MDDKTLNALTALATKLGTTTEYLWGVLLKQAPITAAVDLLVMAAWVAAIFFCFRFVRRKTMTPAKTADDKYPSAKWADEISVVFAWGSVILAALFAAIIIGANLSTTISALVNPEYWALKQILK